ncbi:MAG: PilZ domain-containing protein [Gallionella sp.]|nr:PilZ domain-containing protein [Gallionella sp.]
MPDEKTTDSTASDTPGLPSGPTDARSHEEQRIEPRVHVRWHVDVFVDGQAVYHGFIKDISLKGADVFIDHNLQNVKLVKLLIHVPPLSVTSDHHVVDVSGKVVYTSHDSDELLFRTGINFLKFNLESDQAYLQSRLARH